MENIKEVLSIAVGTHQEGFTIVADIAGRPIIYANQGFEQLTGYPSSEIFGRNCNFLQGNDTDPGTLEYLRRKLSLREACVVTLLNYKKDGQKFWNRLSIYPISVGPKNYFVGVQNDITSLVQTQQHFEILRKAQNLDNERIHGLMNLLRMLQDSMGNLMANLQYLALEADQNGRLSSEALSLVDQIIDQTAEKFLFSSKEEFLGRFDFDRHIVQRHRTEKPPPRTHCLIVEDNLINQIILQKTLEAKGCKVTVANHGEEALAQLQKTKDFSIIFMDLHMPVMDGIECTKKIRETISTTLPVVAVTANTMPEDQALAREAGMNEFIAKPFEVSQIEKVLERFAT
ncbi:MAG: response regulator [Spirochaetota bacterium]